MYSDTVTYSYDNVFRYCLLIVMIMYSDTVTYSYDNVFRYCYLKL